MRILFCNPKNAQGTTHSRQGMYVPLGILSICTVLKERFGDSIEIKIYDEDVANADLTSFQSFDIIGFYSTTFNYRTCVDYAAEAKKYGKITVLGGPHASVLAENIFRKQNCFDYIIRFEAELPFLKLVEALSENDKKNLSTIPNLGYKDEKDKIIFSRYFHKNNLEELSMPLRTFVDLEPYIRNFKKLYPERTSIRPGSLYSSKGCSWRDKTGGCIFCARLEKGVQFRKIEQIWNEICILRDKYKVNSIWDISDDNLNNLEWFKKFVQGRPADCKDLNFFIYSRVNFIKEELIPYMRELNVEEVFLGVESGDDDILKDSCKGQTVETILRAIKVLVKNKIKYFPSFILGLPGENRASMLNTYKLCQQLADLGGLNRLGCTILQPIPGSRVYEKILRESELGEDLATLDDVNITDLEKYWVANFTKLDYETVVKYRDKINRTMKGLKVFGGIDEKKLTNKVVLR